MESRQEMYIGIDLSEEWTQVSYYRPGMEEPETVSTVAGEERYRIPTDMEHLDVHLRKVIRYVPGMTDFSGIGAVTFHLADMDMERVKLLKRIMEQLGVSRERVFVQDDKESFCHFAMHQAKELVQHQVVLFACEENKVTCLCLEKRERTRPVRVEIREILQGELPKIFGERDENFAQMAEEALKGKIVSSVYLTGDGLEGGWLCDSLHVLCRGRRAFQGKNLYSRGACYGSLYEAHKKEAGYIYFGDLVLSKNIFLKVNCGNQTFFHDLAEAGERCYEVERSCQVLLNGEPSVDVWLKDPYSGETRIESLQLTDLPERPPKATRLLIETRGTGKGQLLVRVKDLGLGGWYPSSGKVWEYCIDE